ncbi:unnamed protein product [Protopolystoma xenopodis]|uniref:PDEase domain-containing protein n=1 Tax=Protopolystoma xenopodis TaxID=117903 RepID=A0A3S4ZWI4_9PLAT|nr:unnamed protein product [Protopolystoma xenopodis]
MDHVRDAILATDLAHHLKILPKLKQLASEGYQPSNPVHHNLLVCLLMTSADLSDQSKDWSNAKIVSELLYQEFFRQGDLEKALGTTPAPFMDRERACIPELQISFLDSIAIPCFE